MSDNAVEAIVAIMIGIVIISLFSWIGFNAFYDKYSCAKYTENGIHCVERVKRNETK